MVLIYLIRNLGIHGCPVRPMYQDANGIRKQGKKLAAIHTEGLVVTEIQFFEAHYAS